MATFLGEDSGQNGPILARKQEDQDSIQKPELFETFIDIEKQLWGFWKDKMVVFH
jgi:hypothetical protein